MVTVHRKKMCCAWIEGVKFLPGMNTLSDSEFQAVKDTKSFKSELECENMIIGGTLQTETTDAVDTTNIKEHSTKLAMEIRSLSVAEAAVLIANASDANMLKALKTVDVRSGIQEAIDLRLNQITNQIGSDLKTESVAAPEGTGENFVDNIKVSEESLSGTKAHTAIPALKGKK
jgi:hypothetical protein